MAKITVYSTTTCPYCKMLKDYLTSRDVAYEDILLDEQPEHVQAFIDTCGSMGVPCTHITGDDGKVTTILGFDKARIDDALGIGAAS